MYITLTPSYGRDYKSKAEVQDAWDSGKDFTIADVMHPDSGRQMNRAQARAGTTVNIRYKRMTAIHVIKIK